jgi:hypothetical protein
LTFKSFKAEVLITNFIVENNFSIATADKCVPLLRNMSPDSQITKQYQYVKTKTVCILSRALTPSFNVDLVLKMKANSYTLATGGSNDSYLSKNESFGRKDS